MNDLKTKSTEYLLVAGMFGMLVDDFSCSPKDIMILCKKVLDDNFSSFMQMHSEKEANK